MKIREERRTSKRWLFSILVICLLVATIIPFQVAFIIVFMIQFSICSSPRAQGHQRIKQEREGESPTNSSPTPETWRNQDTREASNAHLLLLLTWLLPFTAPILIVWARTLQTAGYTVPFDGDHHVAIVLPWLLLGEAAASGRVFLREKVRWRRVVTYGLLSALPLIAVLYGARYPYLVFEVATVVATWLVVTRVNWGLFSK